LATVPCCANCNAGFSQDDEYFRLFLTVTEIAKGNPDRQAVLPRVGRSLNRLAARGFSTAFFRDTLPSERFSETGLYLGVGRKYVADGTRLDKTAARIVKGLFSIEKGTRLPDDYVVHTLALARLPALDRAHREVGLAAREFIAALNDAPVRKFGRTFEYRWLQSPNGPFRSLLLLSFYQRPLYFCSTAPRSIE
jgi:hypothetical protein